MEHEIVMSNLKEKLNELLNVIPPGSKVVYLDYPFYLNVGDILIYKGTEHFFKTNNINVVLRMNVYQFDLRLINKYYNDCIIVCQGGGNFGDIYHLHQNLRRKLIENFAGNIVILPQSIHYNDKQNETSEAHIFSRHANLNFFVRDKFSLSIASDFNANSRLMPDMAHYLWNVLNKRNENSNLGKTLYFIRNDCEKSTNQKQFEGPQSYDWDDVISAQHKLLYKVIGRISSLAKILPIDFFKIFMCKFVAFLWQRYTDGVINSAINFFEKYNNVVTSRLHGHIFSCLLSIKNKVIDNSYGKNSRYVNEWTKDSNIVKVEN